MVAHTQSIHILDPCPEESPEVRDTSAALAGVAGKVIGLLENRKYHADAFLQELHKVLEQEYRVKRVVYATKFSYRAPCAEETIATLVEAIAQLFVDGQVSRAAGAFMPSGPAVPVEGGHRVSGRWAFASGIRHAQWVSATTRVVGDGAAAPTLRRVVMPVAAVHIHD